MKTMLDSTEWQSGECGDSLRAGESHSSPIYMFFWPYIFKVCVCVLTSGIVWASLVAQMVKNLPAVQETHV